MARFLSSAVAVAEPVRATTAVSQANDFRLEINCQKGNHYMRVRRFRGKARKKSSGTPDREAYKYLGDAKIVAHERQGIYEQRWIEFRYNHECHYA